MIQHFCDNFDKQLQQANMMGPNALRISEELAAQLEIAPHSQILDLGCGKGLSSILLASLYDVQVVAADLWISPEENLERFQSLGLDQKITPLSLDATGDLPFAAEQFDLIFSVDSYHYFGNTPQMLPKLLQYLKPGGRMAVAVPGLKESFPATIPAELKPFWVDKMYFYTPSWWQGLWRVQNNFQITSCREMDCHNLAWQDWLQSPNPYAQEDRAMIRAEAGKYFCTVQITGRKI